MKEEQPVKLSAPISTVLFGYLRGAFPYGNSNSDEGIEWYDLEERAILPFENLHISRRLARQIRKGEFQVTMDQDHSATVDACSERSSTWINKELKLIYARLFEIGRCHSIEVWQDGHLAGGLIGTHFGTAFFGESMFSRVPNTSKIALVYLVEHLRNTGFDLLDVQILSDHLARLGAIEVPRKEFLRRLSVSLLGHADLGSVPFPTRIAAVHNE